MTAAAMIQAFTELSEVVVILTVASLKISGVLFFQKVKHFKFLMQNHVYILFLTFC